MSNFCTATGDDYPEAAAKHLDDATALLGAKRHDGAGYLAGYVVECSLKTLVVIAEIAREARLTASSLATGMKVVSAPPITKGLANGLKSARAFGHKLNELSKEAVRLAGLPGSVTARYSLSSGTSLLHEGGWRETIRYRACGHVTDSDAAAWLKEASNVYGRTVGRMRRDGVIF